MINQQLLSYIFENFKCKSILQFAGKDESPLIDWLKIGGEIDYIGEVTRSPQKQVELSNGNNLRIYAKGKSDQPKLEYYDIMLFDDRQTLSENITSWNEYRTRLATGGMVIISKAKNKRGYDPLRDSISDAWFDEPTAVRASYEPSFATWLEQYESLQSVHFPQGDDSQGLVILQAAPLPAGIGEVRLCVASYGENLSWLKQLQYDRCIYDATGKRHGLIPIPNRAREAGQYIRHIIMNYGNFADYEIFLQAHPFDHSPNLIQDLAKGIYRERSVRALGQLISFDYAGTLEHDRFAIQLATDLFGGVPHGLHWTFGAQFSASRKAIMSRSLDFWKMLLRKVESEPNTSPWAIERLWLALF